MDGLKSVLITGGTGKVGNCLAEGFARSGWQVILTSRSEERAEKLANDFRIATKSIVHGIGSDFNGPDAPSQLIEKLNERGLSPNCLINSVRNLENLSLDDMGKPSMKGWLEEFYLNVVVAYELSMGLASMNDGRLDSIINISSMYGIVAPTPKLYKNVLKESPIHYGVCKAAVIHLTKELAIRLVNKGIRVNTISYGGIEGRTEKDFVDKYSILCPQGRMLNDNDIAGPALFLSSDAASGITGHNLVADGGWSIW